MCLLARQRSCLLESIHKQERQISCLDYLVYCLDGASRPAKKRGDEDRMKTISNQTFDEERALYGQKNLCVTDCRFDGPADGESAFKEGADLIAERCFFNLRYPSGTIPA